MSSENIKTYKSYLYQIQEVEKKLADIDEKIAGEEIDDPKGIFLEVILFIFVLAAVISLSIIMPKFIIIWMVVIALLVVCFLIYAFMHFNDRRKSELLATRLIEDRLRYEIMLKKLPKKSDVLAILKLDEGDK